MKPWAYLLALLCAAPLAQAADGMLDVHGELVMSACGLHPNSQRLEVGLGLVSSQMFKRIGDRSQPVPFNIRLTECSIDTLTTVAVRFSGAPDGKSRADGDHRQRGRRRHTAAVAHGQRYCAG